MFQLLSNMSIVRTIKVVFSSIKPIILAFFYVGIFASGSSLVNGICLSILSGLSAKISPDTLAAYSVVMRIEVIFMLLISGIGVSIVTGTASSIGKKDFDAVWRVSIVGVLFATIVVGFTGYLVVTNSHWLLKVISVPENIQAISERYLSIICWSYPFMALLFLVYLLVKALAGLNYFL